MLFPESSYPTVNISNEAVHWKEKKNMKEKKNYFAPHSKNVQLLTKLETK